VSTLAYAVGAMIILTTGVDVFRTVLMPSSSGHINQLLSRGLFFAARRAPGRSRPAAMRGSGPLSIVLTAVLWLVLLMVGFALLYLPQAGSFSYSSDVRFDDHGFGSALYLSGTSLLTLGFGTWSVRPRRCAC
jgi:hypothetical protein